MEIDIGPRLRRLREMHGLSQRELAKRAGVSNATISLIEQNRASPSVGSLKKVLDGIPVTMADFFSADEPAREQVFFAAEAFIEMAGEGGLSIRRIGRPAASRAMEILHERYAPGADTGPTLLRHESEEGGVVIRGRVEVTVGDQRQVLGPGDAYYFDSRLPHRFRNTGSEDAEIVSATTPPTF